MNVAVSRHNFETNLQLVKIIEGRKLSEDSNNVETSLVMKVCCQIECTDTHHAIGCIIYIDTSMLWDVVTLQAVLCKLQEVSGGKSRIEFSDREQSTNIVEELAVLKKVFTAASATAAAATKTNHTKGYENASMCLSSTPHLEAENTTVSNKPQVSSKKS